MTRFSFFLALFLLAILALGQVSFVAAHEVTLARPQQTVREAAEAKVSGDKAIMFIENEGQFAPEARFQLFGTEESIWLDADGWWMTVWEESTEANQAFDERVLTSFAERSGKGVHLKFGFAGANPAPRIEPFDRLDTQVSYFMGNEADKWQRDVAVWRGVRYKNIYPGIDLELTSEEGQLVQRLVVTSDTDLQAVRWRIEGADEVEWLPSLSKRGAQGTAIRLATAVGELAVPLLDVVTSEGQRLDARYRVETENNQIEPASIRYSTAAAPQDVARAISYSTFLGGSGSDSGYALAVDEEGNAYLTGGTASTDFPATAGAFDSTYNEAFDLFVAKLNATGSGLLYATFLGGSGADDGFANNIAVDGAGNAYVTGHTSSIDFPVTGGAYDTTYNGGENDSFVAKLNADGTSLLYATYLGGSDKEPQPRLTIDESGNAYVTGRTLSSDFPVNTLYTSHNGGYDAFVSKLDSNGSSLIYSTFLGGSGYDAGHDIQVLNGEAYLVGAAGLGFPVTSDTFDAKYNGCSDNIEQCDAFIVKLTSAGDGLVYGTYMGGSQSDWLNDLVVGSDGSVSAIGITESNDFPMYSDTYDPTFNGGFDTVVAKLSPTGFSLHFSTYFGGSFDDYGNDIALDDDGSVVIAGGTLSPDLPITSDALRSTLGGGQDAYVARLKTGGYALLYSSFLGGSRPDWALGLDRDGNGNFYVTGYTDSADFPITSGALDTAYDGQYDAFVSKLSVGDSGSVVQPTTPSTDLDQDGLLNETETSGWSNGAGTFMTDPNDADSDDDGLQDGEEQRYDTHPNDDKHPGIYAIYEDYFQTKEYIGWMQYGSNYLALDTAVMRRGSVLAVGGPANATIQVHKSIPSLSDLTPVRDAASGRWEIPIEASNTVGQYTITLTEGEWSKSLTLNVIFELPTDLQSSEVGAYLYNDDRQDTRDEISIWFATVEVDNPESPERHTANGYGLWFYNEQYQSYVFEHVIDAINGSTTQSEAILKLGERIDGLTRFDPTYFYFSMYDVLHSYDDRNQCSNIAAALTSFSRSAGIAARPVAVDWDRYILGGDYFDTATEVWLSGEWYTMRGYNVYTGGEDAPLSISGGIVPPLDRRTWGNVHYPDSIADTVAVAGPNWEYSHLSQFNPVSNWDNATPDSINKREWVETVHIPYWGWASEPTRVGDPVSLMNREPVGASAPSALDNAPSSATFTDNYSDAGVDNDGNGQFDALGLTVEVNVDSAGTYTILGKLADGREGNLSKTGATVVSKVTKEMPVGIQSVELLFSGQELFINGQDASYSVQELFIASGQITDTTSLENHILDSRRDSYTTSNYSHTAFESPGATFTAQYSDAGVDNNSNSRYESLQVDVGLTISNAGTYTITGDLQDSAGNQLTSATWSGSDSNAQLHFDGPSIYRHTTNGPYRVSNLRLQNAAGEIIGRVESAHQSSEYNYSDFEGPAALLTGSYNHSPVDTDGNNRYEYLSIEVELNVSEESQYFIEGWLRDKTGHSITWATTGLTILAPGMHTLELKFDGEAIHANQVSGPFTLSGLKVIDVRERTLLDKLETAMTTEEYEYEAFEIVRKVYMPLVIR